MDILVHNPILFSDHTGKPGIGDLKKSESILDKGFLNISVFILSHTAVKPLMPPKVREHRSNCRSKLSMHLNSLFPEKDKDTDLRTETLKMNNSLGGFFASFPLQSSVTLLSELKICTTFSQQIGVYFSRINKRPRFGQKKQKRIKEALVLVISRLPLTIN